MIKKLSVILLLSITLSACGFHLRGKYEYAEQLNPIVIISEDRDFIYELEDAFDFSDLEVADSISGADAILEFTSEVYERKPVSLDERGRATEYRLKYTARYRVLNRNGDALLKRASATATRLLEYNPSQELQANSEERFLKEEMYEDMAQTIARRLSRVTGQVVATAEELVEFEAQLKEYKSSDY